MMNNSLYLTGRFVADPEERYTKKGRLVANFKIAVSNYYDGADHPDFFYLSAFDNTAKAILNYGAKGRQTAFEVYTFERKYTDTTGNTRWATEFMVENFMFLDSAMNATTVANNATAPQPAVTESAAELDHVQPYEAPVTDADIISLA